MDDQNIPGSQKNVVGGNINATNVVIGDQTTTNNYISMQAATAEKTLNMYLCRKLTEALGVYNADAKNFIDNIREADKADWETQERYTRKAKVYLISGFVGVLGMMLQKVISSGKDAFASNNAKDYVEVCIATATRSLQLLCFSFISKLWDHKKERNFEFTRDQLNTLDNFFNLEIELNITDYVEQLRTLTAIFDAQEIEYPFSEFNKDYLQEGSIFNNACKEIEAIKSMLDTNQVIYSNAFKAENELTAFLCVLSFLANYKMVSVKDITYNDIRNETVCYLHSYTFLGVDNDDKLFSSKFKYDDKPVSNDAVLLYRDKYQQGLNLFPFIVDINALTNEMEVKLCFYTFFEERKKRLTYTDINKIASDKSSDFKSIGDPSQVVIQFNDDMEKDFEADADHDMTGVISNADKFKMMQLNVVYKIFQRARECILG